MQIWNVEHALEQLIWFPQQVNEIEEKVRELFCLKETRNIANNAMCGLDIDSNQLKKKFWSYQGNWIKGQIYNASNIANFCLGIKIDLFLG